MIDLHSHILPGMDDGAQDLYDSLEMIALAQRSGVTAMVATPHCNIPGRYQNYFSEQYKQAVTTVREAVRSEGLRVQIFPGMEAFGTADLPNLLQEGKIMTLNQGRYLLVEFAFEEDPAFADRLLQELRDIGVIPVIAHAERYRFVQRNPEIIYKWRTSGYPIQVNKGSFQGRFGNAARETAYLLMNHHLVSVVASDAHSPYQRTPFMADAYEELLTEYPESYLDMVFRQNPGRICKNEPILGLKAKRIE